MAGEWQQGRIAGVWRRSAQIHPDARGSFSEIWRASWFAGLPGQGTSSVMRQANVSRSEARVLRGMHMHRRQADLWTVLEGDAFIALVDVRPMLHDIGEPIVDTLDATAGDTIFLPEGVAHGFYARKPITLAYLVTNEYDGTDELGFAWDDPRVAIPWPDTSPIVSPRDATAPSLAELVATLRSGDQQIVSEVVVQRLCPAAHPYPGCDAAPAPC